MDSSMKPSPIACPIGNVKQNFGEEITKPGLSVA